MKTIQDNEIDHTFVMHWVRKFKGKELLPIPHNTMLGTRITMLNSCEDLLDAAYQSAIKLSTNANHVRICPTTKKTFALYDWFISGKGLTVKSNDYFKMLTRQVEVICVELEKMIKENHPDHEYHKLRTMDVLIDYHHLSCVMCKIV